NGNAGAVWLYRSGSAARRTRTARAELARRRRAQDALEDRTLEVARRAALRRMAQAVAHGAEMADGGVELVRLRGEQLAVDARLAVRSEHSRHLGQREARRATHGDQCQPLQHGGIEQAPQPAPPDGDDEALFFVMPQCGRR